MVSDAERKRLAGDVVQSADLVRAEDAREANVMMVQLHDRGYRPGLQMVTDLVAIALRGEAGAQQASDRSEGCHVARSMIEVARVLSRRFGPFQQHAEKRLGAARRFLCTWVSTAPAPSNGNQDFAMLEMKILRDLDAEPDCPWAAWRRSEELEFRSGGSASFLRALAEVEADLPGASGWMDESIWNLSGIRLPTPRGLDVISRRGGGIESEAMRMPSGVFREVAPHGLPDDPARIAPADLALLAGSDRSSKALLAAKLADDALLVRFGAVQRPARRMPNVLVCIAMFDTPEMYVQRPGCFVPDVDPLRELMVRAIPLVIHALASNKANVSLSVQRRGSFVAGDWQAGDIKDQYGQLRGAWRKPAGLLRHLQRSAPWLFTDCASYTRVVAAPDLEKFDASYLLSFGQPPSGYPTEWTASSVVSVGGDGTATLRFFGPQARDSILFGLPALASVAEAMVDALGLTIARLEADESAFRAVPAAEFLL